MGYGEVEYTPFTSMLATLEIIDAEEVDGKFEDTPKQVQVEIRVVDYEESEEDGGAWIEHTFRDWLAFSVDKTTGRIGISKSPKAKLRAVIRNTLGEGVITRGEFEPEKLIGQLFRSRVVRSGKHEDGSNSRIKAETVGPPSKRPKKDADLEGVDAESLDMGRQQKADNPEAPDFSDLKEEAS